MDRNPSEELVVIRRGRSADDRYPIPRDDALKALAELDPEDLAGFRADVDALADPSPRPWPEPR